MVARCKKHTRDLKGKLPKFHIVSTGLILVTSLLAGGVFVASKIQAHRLDEQASKQTALIDQQLASLKKAGAENTGKTPGDTAPKQAAPTATTPPAPAPVKATTPTPRPKQTPVKKPASPAPTQPAVTGGLETTSSLNYINNLRASVGKPALTQNTTMNQWALAHAKVLAAQCTLFHQNLNTFVGKNIGPITTRSIAENVGYASTILGALNGLKNSPGHYANMTGDFRYVGLGVATGCSGNVYTTQIFAR